MQRVHGPRPYYPVHHHLVIKDQETALWGHNEPLHNEQEQQQPPLEGTDYRLGTRIISHTAR